MKNSEEKPLLLKGHQLQPVELPANQTSNDIEPRLNVALCVVFIALGITVGLTLIYGPSRLHDSNGIRLVGGIGAPWEAWGILFLIYSAFLTNKYTRVLGYGLGLVLYGFYFVSVTKSISEGNAGSIIGLSAAVFAVTSHVRGMVVSMVASEWR